MRIKKDPNSFLHYEEKSTNSLSAPKSSDDNGEVEDDSYYLGKYLGRKRPPKKGNNNNNNLEATIWRGDNSMISTPQEDALSGEDMNYLDPPYIIPHPPHKPLEVSHFTFSKYLAY